ncbi:hypothetical protein O1611_g6921 [Lasiodiplodia mahajangana]|uniref:Uncharacterized protein n=1 Tax=Lasiodiplodia mahajangana TaxID=1108764 RepID=A0ACC2JHF1_9PEZI|nr:hypothetical protein O1611_g6921 [Lasiodiplodia mahajangana]
MLHLYSNGDLRDASLAESGGKDVTEGGRSVPNVLIEASNAAGMKRKGKGLEHAAGSATDVTLPSSLAQTAYIEKYISIFLAKYFPAGRAPAANFLGSSRDWIDIAHGLHTSDKAIQLSLLSLGLFAAGESHYAIQSYGRALSKLRKALCIPSQAQNDSTLATCQLLSLIEIFHGAEEDAQLQGSKWRSHLSGLLALIRARSPYAYQSGAGHQLFADARYPLLISALKDRQRFPLNTPEWRMIPWEKEPKSSIDKLYDIIADLTDILADTDEMRSCRDLVQKTNMHYRVLITCQGLDESLQDWAKEVGPLTKFYDSNGALIDPTKPSDMLLAHMTLWYWTAYTILYSTLVSIHDPLLSEIPTNIDPLPYIRNVANALPYFWSPAAGMYGANLAASSWGFCLQVAWATPHLYSQETALLEQYTFDQTVSSTVLPFLSSLQKSSAGPSLAKLDGKQGMILRAQSWLMGNANDPKCIP